MGEEEKVDDKNGMTHPIFIRNTLQKMNVAHTKYLRMKEAGNENMADYYLTKADCLAGEVMKMRESLIGRVLSTRIWI